MFANGNRALTTSRKTRPLSLPLAFAFNNCDVSVERERCKSLSHSAGLWPFHFQPVDLGAFTNPKHHSRIVGRQITSTSNLCPAPLQVSGLISDSRPHCIRIRLLADQSYPQPMVLAADIVLQ